ncbi:MAG: putative PEP-binding protein, partial [Mariprofundales bacterium]|nr:putative PEP-binding protein [Mariprofundales bacterium]
AGATGNLKVMFPMVATVEEVRQARAILEACRAELQAEGQPVAEEMEVGIMVEVPAAALMADRLAAEVDFFSIGTNDLIQYTLAADRCNGDVLDSGLALSDHPAIIQMIELTAASARRAEIPISLCGELAADPAWSSRLIGMGITTLSMSSSHILPLRRHISQLTVGRGAP